MAPHLQSTDFDEKRLLFPARVSFGPLKAKTEALPRINTASGLPVLLPRLPVFLGCSTEVDLPVPRIKSYALTP